jgi:hypothetical protein
MSGTATISTSEAKIGAIKIQQSTYGAVIPIVWGRTRVTGNLIWYGDFQAVPHTTTTESGGKGGGGVEQSNTTYTYTASVAMSLCEGPILDVVTTWRGKNIFLGSAYSGAPARAVATTTYPAPGSTYTVANTNGWKNVSVEMQVQAAYASDFSYNTAGSWVTLIPGVDYSCTGGVYTFNDGATKQGSNLRITYTYQSINSGTSCLSQIGLNLISGIPGQAPWSYLTTKHPSEALGYSGIAYVAGANYSLDSGASVENHAFEVQTGFSYSATVVDADPSVIVQDALTNSRYGADFGLEKLGPLTNYSQACLAQGIVLSPALTEQMTTAAFLDTMAQLTNVGMVWSGGVLKFIPFTDTQVTGNGVTYTPINTPVYDLTDDDFQPVDDEGPIRVKRGAVSDSYNLVRLEYLDRANDYNIAIMPATDQADILENGERPMPVVTAHWITDSNVAKIVATLILQRSMFIRNTYEFRLGWTKIGLEPMDIVTLTDSNLGLNLQPVRILTVEEDEDGYLSLTAEDFPKGSASATLYPSGTNGGYTPNFNESPGQVTIAPVIFEGPAALASNTSGLEVWLAAGSLTPEYGGCQVWVSLTGNNYQYAATLHGSSRFGTFTTALAAGTTGATTTDTVGVSLAAGGQLLSGSLTDMQSLTTLCYADGEFFAYENSTLTGASAYTIGNHMLRGAFLSSAASHASGAKFVRCDDAVARVPLTADYIGKTIYIKLLAFNRYGGALTDLASATQYTYAVTGSQANLPPIAPMNVGVEAAFTIDTAKFKWDRIANAATYNVQIWAGSPLAKVREVNVGNALRYDYSANDARVDGGPWRSVTFKVQGINANGAVGAFSSYVASNTQLGALTGAAVNSNSSAVQFTCDRPAASDFSGVRVYLSTTSGFTPGASTLVYDGPNTNVTINRTQAGALLSAGTTYYVKAAAYDTFGTDNLTFTSEMSVTISNMTPTNSATVFLYQYATMQPAVPTGTSSYTWATGAHASYTPAAGASPPDNWTLTGGSNPGTPGVKLYVAIVQITAAVGVASSTVSWSAATVAAWAQNGANGTNAIQAAAPTVYRWDTSVPAGPSGSVSYRWSDGVFGPTPLGSSSVAPTNWSLTPGTAPSPGYTLYAAKVALTDSAANTTTAFNWTSASISAIGQAPYAGSSYVTAYCASASTSATGAPSPTTGQTSLPAANSGGITGTWSSTVPALTTSQYLYQVDGIYNPANNTVTWSIPYWSSLKVGSLSAISANLGSITAGSISINGGIASIDSAGNAVFKSIQIQDGSGNVLLSSGGAGSIPTSISNAATTATWSGVTGTGKPDDNANYTSTSKGAALNDDPGFENVANAWTLMTGIGVTYGTSAPGAVGTNLIYADSGLDRKAWSKRRFPIDANKVYNLTAVLYAGAGNDRNQYVFINFFDYQGNQLSTSWGGTMSGYTYGGQTPVNTWTRQGGQIGPGTARTIPAGAQMAEIGVWLQYSGAGGTSTVRNAAMDVRIEEVTIASNAAAAAAAANAAIALISDDNTLSKGEKSQVIAQWNAIAAEKSGLDTQASALGVSSTAYDNAYSALQTYLTSVSYSDTTTDTTIVGSTFRTNFTNYYSAKQALINAMAAQASTMAVWSTVSGAGKPANNANATYRQSVRPVGQVVGDQWVDTGTTNLAQYSETLSNAAYVLEFATKSTATPPTGISSAIKLVESTAATTTHDLYQAYAGSTSTAFSASYLAKAGERTALRVTLCSSGFTNGGEAYFDLSAGTVLSSGNRGSGTGTTATIYPFGNGWYWCTVTTTPNTAATIYAGAVCSIGTNSVYTGDGTSGLYLAAHQFEVGAGMGSYVVTTGSASANNLGNNAIYVWNGTQWVLSSTTWGAIPGPNKPADNASADIVLVAGGTATVLSNTIAKPAATLPAITNGSFASNLNGWTTQGSVAWSSGIAQLTPNGSTAALIGQSVTTTPGRTYSVTFDILTGPLIVVVGTSGYGASDLYNAAATTSPVGAGQTITFTATTTTSYISFTRTAAGTYGVDNVFITETWDGGAYSKDSFTGGAYASAVTVDATHAIIFGLNSAGDLTAVDWTGIDYGIYLTTGGTAQVREFGGVPAGSYTPPSYAAGDVFAVTYDGSSVKYLKNGTVFYTSIAAASLVAGQTLFFDSSFLTSGGQLNNVRFGPLSSNNWASVGGTNKPADNATVGAPAGTMVGGVLAENIATAYTNFNASNDRNSAAITAPTILTDGSAVDHTIRTDGAADISFEWAWSGNEGDIDGFQVYVYQSSSSAAYTFGTTPTAETVYTVPAAKRAFILFGAAANLYTTFGVRAYRSVDKDINAAGVILSTLVKPSLAAENPYRPSANVAFNGDIIGTVNGIPAANVNKWTSVTGKPDDSLNLLNKSTFEDGSVGQWYGINAISVVSVTGQTFSKALQFVDRDTYEGTNTFPVTPGETLYVSGWLDASTAGYTVAFGCTFQDSAGVTLANGGWNGPAALAKPTGWTYVTGSLTVPTGAFKGCGWLQIGGLQSATDKGTARAAGLRISRFQSGATTNIVTQGTFASRPAGSNGDFYYATDTQILYQKVSGSWVAASNNYTNTNQLTDGAGLGTTATWSGVSGTGKPADNATVGATFGTNIGGQITAGTASTYIANGAIQNAQIGNAAIQNANIANLAVSSGQIQDLRTSNYAEDGSGNPTAGAKLASQGTALKVANNAFQIGTATFSDYWFRLVQGIDGNISSGKVIWRGNNDSTTRGGAPNINCLSVYTQCDQVVQSDFQQTYLTYTLTPTSYTAYSDNLDAMTQIHIQFFASTTAAGPITETYQPCASRVYDGGSGAVSGSLAWGWRFANTGAVPYAYGAGYEQNGAYSAYVRVRIANTYGWSASKDLYGGGSSAAVGRQMTAATITGVSGTSASGGGTAGGACPAPWVKVRLVNGTDVNAGDLHEGARVMAVDDSTMEPIPGGGVLRDVQIIWAERYRVKLTDGRATEWSENHRFAVVDRGWVHVQNLRAGDHIMGLDECVVESVLMVGEGQVVSYRVDGAGTYFAGGMLCHNYKMIP